jgi:hypothetical protein
LGAFVISDSRSTPAEAVCATSTASACADTVTDSFTAWSLSSISTSAVVPDFTAISTASDLKPLKSAVRRYCPGGTSGKTETPHLIGASFEACAWGWKRP